MPLEMMNGFCHDAPRPSGDSIVYRKYIKISSSSKYDIRSVISNINVGRIMMIRPVCYLVFF